MTKVDTKWDLDKKGNFPLSFDNGRTWYAIVGDQLKGPVNSKEDAEILITASN